MPGAKSFDYWFAMSERSYDCRTGAFAYLVERPRGRMDRPGKNEEVWDWMVRLKGEVVARGTAQTRSGARRKCRDVVGKLPDQPDQTR